jgi:hypothetical protein
MSIALDLQTNNGIPLHELLLGQVSNWTVSQFIPSTSLIREVRDTDIIWAYHAPVLPVGRGRLGAGKGSGAGAAAPMGVLPLDVVVCLTRREVGHGAAWVLYLA